MKALLPSLLVGCFLFSLNAVAQGQAAISSGTSSAVSFQVLQQKRVDVGSRSIIYNLVEPPVLQKRPVIATAAVQPTAEEEQAAILREEKSWQQFCFSATIYDHRITEITWGNGGQYRAYSNIDFNHFCFTESVETDTTVYELYFMASNESSEYAPDAAKHLPRQRAFAGNKFGYILDKCCPAPPAEALAALDALHAYYNANSQKLAADYVKSVAEQRAKELWEKEHPPVPKDTVVNFWPVKSAAYLGAENKEGK